jgi:ATP-dependent helicase YprA (DUF1998 family)
VASSGCIQHTPLPLFIACSATMTYPEEHFRVLCPITEEESVCVLAGDEDGSPCSPKHFFVWNAPVLGESMIDYLLRHDHVANY